MSPAPAHRRLWADLALTRADLAGLLETAQALKQAQEQRGTWQPLHGRHIALMSSKIDLAAAQMRHAVAELGASFAWLDSQTWFGSTGARVPEAARMLGRLYDAVDCYDLPLDRVAQIDGHAAIAVFDGVARDDHPSRLIAEWLTLRDVFGRPLDGLALRLEGDPHSPTHRAAMLLAELTGMTVLPAQRLAQVSLVGAGTGDDAAMADDGAPVLDTTSAAAPALAIPQRPAGEPARLARLRADNRKLALQSLLLSTLS